MDGKRFIVTATDQTDIEHGLPEFKAEFGSLEDAREYVLEDMRTYSRNYTYTGEDGIEYGPAVYDENGMYIESAHSETSCRWTITEADR